MTAGLSRTFRSLLGVSRLRLLARLWPIRAAAVRSDAAPRLLIIPSDPWTLTGAKGDEAMILAVSSQMRAQHPQLTVGVVTATQQAEQAAVALGLLAVPAWSRRFSRDFAAMRSFAPDRVAILGADVMDGYYSPQMTARLLLLADAMARCGAKVVFLGFSFNASPSKLLRPLFNRLHPAVTLNVRDTLSLERLRSFCRAPASLVADAAFMLAPAEATAGTTAPVAWCAARRAAGDVVLGFNIHPMLVRSLDSTQVDALTQTATGALRAVAGQRAVSFLLISHDYRGAQSDDACLEPVYRSLHEELGARLMYPTQKFGAAELKSIAGATDGVVTGRMHLAIACLGMGRPVAALTYQDKFQGLFRHFDYPEKYLMAPAQLDAQSLARMVCELIDELPALNAKVAGQLPAVVRASGKNVERLL
jgi:polysaccharide pyruvyl transferase WcaK-like protein